MVGLCDLFLSFTERGKTLEFTLGCILHHWKKLDPYAPSENVLVLLDPNIL
jgi:hypothetical protein